MITPSMSLSSRTRRRSCTKPGLNVATSFSRASLMRSSARLASMSHSVLISTLGMRAKPRFRALPWPRMPMLATTTLSLAPMTRPDTDGAALTPAGRRKSLPATKAAAATPPTRVANARRDIAFWSFGSLDTVTSCSGKHPTRGRTTSHRHSTCLAGPTVRNRASSPFERDLSNRSPVLSAPRVVRSVYKPCNCARATACPAVISGHFRPRRLVSRLL